MNKSMIRIALCLLPVPLLAACGDDPAPTVVDDESRDAAGDVLGGSISDDMLQLDDLRSTSPAARETQSGGSGSSGSSSARNTDTEPTAPAEEEPAAPAPAAPETPEAAAEPEAE